MLNIENSLHTESIHSADRIPFGDCHIPRTWRRRIFPESTLILLYAYTDHIRRICLQSSVFMRVTCSFAAGGAVRRATILMTIDVDRQRLYLRFRAHQSPDRANDSTASVSIISRLNCRTALNFVTKLQFGRTTRRRPGWGVRLVRPRRTAATFLL